MRESYSYFQRHFRNAQVNRSLKVPATSNPACRRSRRPCFHLEVFQLPSQKFSRKYLTRHKKSGQLWRRAARITPGGVESNVRYFKPHPFLADYGDGGYIYDVDGNKILDLMMGFGALLLGHNNRDIRADRGVPSRLLRLGLAPRVRCRVARRRRRPVPDRRSGRNERRDQRGLAPAEPGVGGAGEPHRDSDFLERLEPRAEQGRQSHGHLHIHDAEPRCLGIWARVPFSRPTEELASERERTAPAAPRDRGRRPDDVLSECWQQPNVGAIQGPDHRTADGHEQ